MMATRLATARSARLVGNSFSRSSIESSTRPLRLGPHGTTRLLSTEAVSSSINSTKWKFSNPNFSLGLGGGLLLAGLHSATGSANDFYDYRFKSPKDPDDLASFYGGEELMELFCILPIVGQILMRNGHFDEEGNVLTTGIPGTLKVSMVFSDEENENTGKTDWFNKRERFRNYFFGYTAWDMVINFGFRTLEDGSYECYHYGEYFHGNLPIVSQIMKTVFQVHARWVAWSTEHHINHYAFTAHNEEEEEMEEKSRANMPLFLLRNYAWSDLTAILFGYKDDVAMDKRPSFLVRGSSEDNDAEDEEEDKLPFQQKAIKIQISEDIAADRKAMKDLLAPNATKSSEDVKAILTRSITLKRIRTKKKTVPNMETNVYSIAKDCAADRALVRRATRMNTRKARERTTSTQMGGQSAIASTDVATVVLDEEDSTSS